MTKLDRFLGALFLLLAVAVISGALPVKRLQQIVTLEVAAPDSERATVKGIVGAEPITLSDRTGATWTVYIKAVEVR